MSTFSGGPNIVTDGLVLFLDAGNTKSYPGSGTTWTDISRSGNNGTLTNGPTFNSSNGGSIVFDGVDDYGNNASFVSNNSNFTICFWLYHNNATNVSRGIISTWGTAFNGFGIASTSAGQIRSWCNNGASNGINWEPSSTIYNKWAYLCLTYNYSTRTQSGYINGVFKNSESLPSTSVTHSSLQIARGGSDGGTPLSIYPYMNCRISNVCGYNVVLSQSQILQNYNATRGRFGL